MPTSSQMQLPKSRSADEFETMCADVLSCLEDTNFQRYGRNGQSQNGIDLYANQFTIVAQCKNYFNPSNLVNQLANDYSAA